MTMVSGLNFSMARVARTLHHSLEDPILNLFFLIHFLYFGDEVIIKLASLLSPSCAVEIGFASFLGGC